MDESKNVINSSSISDPVTYATLPESESFRTTEPQTSPSLMKKRHANKAKLVDTPMFQKVTSHIEHNRR